MHRACVAVHMWMSEENLGAGLSFDPNPNLGPKD